MRAGTELSGGLGVSRTLFAWALFGGHGLDDDSRITCLREWCLPNAFGRVNQPNYLWSAEALRAREAHESVLFAFTLEKTFRVWQACPAVEGKPHAI